MFPISAIGKRMTKHFNKEYVCICFSVVHVVIIYVQNSFNKTNVQMYMKWLELDHNTVKRFGLDFLALLFTVCYMLKG